MMLHDKIIKEQGRIEGGYPVTSNQLILKKKSPPKTPRCKPRFDPSSQFLNTVTIFKKS